MNNNDVQAMSEKHIEENLDLYTEGKITTSQRRILMNQWCGKAWSQIDHDSVVRGFKKLGITISLDGSLGHLVNILLPEYEMPTDYMHNEFTVDSEGESDTSLELSSEDSDSDTQTN